MMLKVIKELKNTEHYKGAMKHLLTKSRSEGFELCYYTPNELFSMAEFVVDNSGIQSEHEGIKRELFDRYSPYEYDLLWQLVSALRSNDLAMVDQLKTEIKISNTRVRRILSNYIMTIKIKTKLGV